MICQYGCGQEAKFQFKNGKWCCEEFTTRCPALKTSGKKAWNSGLTKENDERIKKYSNSRKGTIPWNKGLSKETSEKIKNISLKISKSKKAKKRALKSKIKKYNKQFLNKKRQIVLDFLMLNIQFIIFLLLYSKHKEFEKYKKKQHNKGLKYNKITQLRKNHPFFCKIEKVIQDKENNLWVKCKNCGQYFIPTRNHLYARIDALEKNDGNEGSYFYCSDNCKNECPLYNLRSDYFLTSKTTEYFYTREEYQTFRQHVLERDNYKCQYCGEPAEHVHHERPQKLEPFFALDPDLAWSVCFICHYKYGHKDECSTGWLSSKQC